MKFFHNLILALIATLAMSTTACDAGTSGSDASQKDVSTTFDSSYGELQIPFGAAILTIHIETPDGKPADFYVCSASSGCYGSKQHNPFSPFASQEFPYDQPNEYYNKYDGLTSIDHHEVLPFQNSSVDLAVYAVRQNHLFNYQKVHYVRGDKKEDTVNVSWTEIGSWGLAPHGVYHSSYSGKNESVSTSVKNGKVVLTWFVDDAIVTNDVLSPYSPDSYFQISGNILPDLSQIQVKIEAPVEPQKKFTSTLTIVK